MTSPHQLDTLADQTTNEPTWMPDSPTRSSTTSNDTTMTNRYSVTDKQPISSHDNAQTTIATCPQQTNHTESGSRESRVKFRHERKIARRRAQRQQEAIERQTRAQQKRQALEAEWALNPALKVVKSNY
jgi:hypothetical protein